MNGLKKKDLLTLGFMMFSIYFGAGNLIFPPALGQAAGDHTLHAMLGFMTTGIGLPLLGITAIALAGGEGLEHPRVRPSRPDGGRTDGEALQQTAGRRGRHDRVAGVHMVDCSHELLQGGVLEEEAVGAGTQRSSSLMEHLALMSAGISRRDLVEVVEGALTTAIEPAVYAEALDLIEGHRRAGHDVVVVSASISEMVAPIARLVGADRAVATHMEVGEDGLFTGRISRSMLHSEKVVALHEDAAAHGIDPARCWAYSDSISDEPMLSAVGHPVAVNPDRDLRRLAQERDWPVRDFARPVRLRPRWEPPSLSTRASVIAHVAGVLAVGGTAAWLMARRRPRGARGL